MGLKAELPSALDVVALLEPLDAAGGVHQMLLAGEEGVALRADFHLDVLGRGLGLDHVSACAGDRGVIS